MRRREWKWNNNNNTRSRESERVKSQWPKLQQQPANVQKHGVLPKPKTLRMCERNCSHTHTHKVAESKRTYSRALAPTHTQLVIYLCILTCATLRAFAFFAVVLVIFLGLKKKKCWTRIRNAISIKLLVISMISLSIHSATSSLLFLFACKHWRSSLWLLTSSPPGLFSVSGILFLSFLEFRFFFSDIRHVCVCVCMFVLVIMLFKCVPWLFPLTQDNRILNEIHSRFFGVMPEQGRRVNIIGLY